MPLHIKYRPQSFDEVFGNSEVVFSVESKVELDDIPHAWLFTGPSGCGKTTMARLLADALGCDTETSLHELNISDTRGIDAARKLMSDMHYRPQSGSVRVYILDEVQEATGNFQNAILKALEDTPSHVHFILCTTDPQKLLNTIRNRCATYEMRPLDYSTMKGLLEWVLESEQVELTPKVIKQVVNASNGSPRQALVILEQIIDLETEEEQLAAIKSSDISQTDTRALCKALLDRNAKWKNVAKILKGLDEKDPEKVRWAVLGYMNAALLGGNQQAALAIECFCESFRMTGVAGLTLACYLTKKG